MATENVVNAVTGPLDPALVRRAMTKKVVIVTVAVGGLVGAAVVARKILADKFPLIAE